MSSGEQSNLAPTIVADCTALAETQPAPSRPLGPEDARVGQVIGARYRIERLLGQGGMGAVFSAVELATEQQVAIKLLRDYARFDSELLERFLQESLASALIHHPNVVRALGAFYDDTEGPVLILELLDGETLADFIARARRVPLRTALLIAAQVAEGVAAAHARGVIHRDLKPANVFLESGPQEAEPRARVLDFGIALLRDYRQSASNAALMGTLNYMAPEQFMDAQSTDERTDIYALGMTLYEMLAGETPFEHTAQGALVNQILFDEVPRLSVNDPAIPESVSDCVARAVQHAPRERYQTMAEFGEALTALRGEYQ